MKIAICAVLLAAFGIAAVKAQTPPAAVAIKLGTTGAAPKPGFEIARARDMFKPAGIDLTVQNFGDTSTVRDAVIAGQMQLGTVGFATALQAISLGAPLKVVGAMEYAFTDHSGHPYQAVLLIARGDRNIHSIADLKGKKVAVSDYSSGWYTGLTLHLADKKVNQRDVLFLVMPFTQMSGALSNGEVDAAIITSTEYVRLKTRMPVDVLMTGTELTGVPLDISSVVIARSDYLAKNSAVVSKFLGVLVQSRMLMKDDIEHNQAREVKDTLKTRLKFTDELVDAYFDYRASAVLKEEERVNWVDVPAESVNLTNKLLIAGGLLRGAQPAPYDKVVDMSYLRQAYKDLGRPWDDTKTGM